MKPQDTQAASITFGVELETTVPVLSGLSVGNYHNGTTVHVAAINGTTQHLTAPTFNGAHWKAERDGSIRVNTGRMACEFVSPILHGSDGVTHLIDFIKWAKAIGANVNGSCGVHITVGVKSIIGTDDPQAMSEYARKLAHIVKWHAIVFDDRVHADTPRHARQEMKKLLGLDSLSGIVYSITEIPMDLIREIVDARIAELAGGAPLQSPIPADVEALVMDRLQPILRRLAALEQLPDAPPRSTRFDPLADLPELTPQPDWNLVKRHLRRYGNPRKTAAKYGLDLRKLNARARSGGWV